MAGLVRAGLVTYGASTAATMHPSELTRALEPMLSPTPR
jgi:hypothetical protein